MKNDYNHRVQESLKNIHIVKIDQLEDVLQLIAEQPWDDCAKRYRAPYFYRGLPNAEFHLQTTLQRNCGEKRSFLESVILRNFAKYAIENDPQISESVWRQMVIGQHHGLPTRLLDWSYSPLVALHFALSESAPNALQEHDCAIWKIDCNDVIAALPKKYKALLTEEKAYLFTVEMLTKLASSLEDYDDAMQECNAIAMLEPPSIDQRIINQLSFFTVIPTHLDCLEEFIAERMPNTVCYIIDKNLRWRIRDMLDQMNVNERIMLPGLDGLAMWLKRYYHVK